MRKDLGRSSVRLATSQLGAARQGKATTLPARGEDFRAWRGEACRGLAWQDAANNTSRRGGRFLGEAGQGDAGRGWIGQTTSPARGTAFMASQPRALQAGARRGIHASPARGTDFSAWHFLAWLSRAVLGSARQTTPPEREEDFWERLGQARRGAVRRGTANNTPQRWGEDFRAVLDWMRCGKAVPGKTRQ